MVRSAPLILVTLQGAARTGRRVLLGYVDQQGTPSDRVIRPVTVEGGWVTAWDQRATATRRFALHRVTGVLDVEDVLPGGEFAGYAWPYEMGGAGGFRGGLGADFGGRPVSADPAGVDAAGADGSMSVPDQASLETIDAEDVSDVP